MWSRIQKMMKILWIFQFVSSVSLAAAASARTLPFLFGNSTGDSRLPPAIVVESDFRRLPQNMSFFGSNQVARVSQHLSGSLALFTSDLYRIGWVEAYSMTFDTRNESEYHNQAWFRVGNNTNDLAIATDIISGNGTIFNPKAIVVATWYKVEAYNGRAGPQNTFQVALPYSDTGETWAIFAYAQLEYFQSDPLFTAGNTAYARATRSNGGSRTIAIVNSNATMNQLFNGTNCNRPGIYAVRLNAGGPTNAPTKAPTYPTIAPSKVPSKIPTNAPSKVPTKGPSNAPTSTPTNYPTTRPSNDPTNAPSKVPTNTPSNVPTHTPSFFPTDTPSNLPINAPSIDPTDAPTQTPMNAPFVAPTFPRCGLFGWSLFCPLTLCGFFGRWMGFCQLV